MLTDKADSYTVQEAIVKTRLGLARSLALEGNLQHAERLYKQALCHAQAGAGENSPLAGSVLLDLIDFYETQGRYGEAKALWESVHRILITHLPSLLTRASSKPFFEAEFE